MGRFLLVTKSVLLRPRFGTRRLRLKSSSDGVVSDSEQRRVYEAGVDRPTDDDENVGIQLLFVVVRLLQLHAWIRQSTTAIQMAAAAADPVFTTATTLLLPPQTALNVSRWLWPQ